MLIKRTITALIAIPILVALIHWGSGITFLAIIMFVTGTALAEFYEISLSHLFLKVVAILAGLVCVVLIYYYQNYLNFETSGGVIWCVNWSIALLTITVFLILLIQFVCYPKKIFLESKAISVLLGVVYVSLFLSFLILIRNSEEGKYWVFFILLVVWSGDSGAYIVGSWKGKHQFCPLASPKKTVEGALGGIVASLLAAFCAKIWFLEYLSLIHCTVLALGIGMVGQLGDLCESTLKRIKGVKDSGNFLPGHGGMLDRIDSLLFTAPLVYYYKILIL